VSYSAVEDLRYQHLYHPIPIEQKCPALADVLIKISGGAFGDSGVYEPYVSRILSMEFL
jgi:starch phosphorylase